MKPIPQTVKAQVDHIMGHLQFWSYVFDHRDQLDPVAVEVVHARCCTAGDIKEHLAAIPDEHLDLLDDPLFRPAL